MDILFANIEYTRRIIWENYNYTPQPIDTKDVRLPQELNELAESIAKNVHEVWSAGLAHLYPHFRPDSATSLHRYFIGTSSESHRNF